MNRTTKRIWNTVTLCLVILVVILAILISGTRFFGYPSYTVLSGSMEPTYHVGSLVYVKEVKEPAEIKVGDTITFVMDDSLTVVTHRVAEISPDGQYFYTKGDANEARDGSPVHYKNVIGTVAFSIPHLGRLANFVKAPPGLYLVIAGALILLILCFVPEMLDKADAADKKKAAKKQKKAQTP